VNADAATVPDPNRKVAMLLHGLAEPDRTWVLGQLGEHHARSLQPLLGELLELGLCADPALTVEALRSQAAEGHAAFAKGTHAAAIARASAEQMRHVLEGEPSALVATLLKCDNWPWRDAFLASLTPERSRAVRDSAMDGGPALVNALLIAVAQRLSLHAQPSATPVLATLPQRAGPPWARFISRLAAWRMRTVRSGKP
jgi:hypothetical protein